MPHPPNTLLPFILLSAFTLLCVQPLYAQPVTYPIVDTRQAQCYNASAAIAAPLPGEAFFGQDAQHPGRQPVYAVSADTLTVYDNVTGLTWQRGADTNGDGFVTAADKMSYAEAVERPGVMNAARYGGYGDWRLPTIKELYSLIDYRGVDPNPNAQDGRGLTPFIDRAVFPFAYGDPSAGERIIDAQYASSTPYTSTTMNGAETVFGVNFADGRIKGYPRSVGPGGRPMRYYVLCVRGNPAYGRNDLVVHTDSTVTDRATGLMWAQGDQGVSLNWQQALAWAQEMNARRHLGYGDWRLPDVKELQSIVEYSRSPDHTSSPAIDPVFACTRIINEAGQSDYPGYWSSTTHASAGGAGASGAYVAFGRGMGYMNGAWIDVHGAGCQRSDPKEGDPANYPYGRGPQGDAIRIYNAVRLVRDVSGATGVGHGMRGAVPGESPGLAQSYPNPGTGAITIGYTLPEATMITLRVYDAMGRLVAIVAEGMRASGRHTAGYDVRALVPGVYRYVLSDGRRLISRTMTVW